VRVCTCILWLFVAVGIADRLVSLVIYVSSALCAAADRRVHVPSCVPSNLVCFGVRLLFLFASVSRFLLYMSTRLLFLADNLDTLDVSRYVLRGGGESRGGGARVVRRIGHERTLIRVEGTWLGDVVDRYVCHLLSLPCFVLTLFIR